MLSIKVSAAILLLVPSAIRAMEENPLEISPLTNLENQIAGYEQDPHVKNLAQYFIKSHSQIQHLPNFDDHRSATLIVNALFVAFKHNQYPVDNAQATANSAPRATKRLIRLALYAIDNICLTWHQAHNPEENNKMPTIPLEQLERDYLFAINRLEGAIRVNAAPLVAQHLKSYLQKLSKNK